jgi:hypothetical protein
MGLSAFSHGFRQADRRNKRSGRGCGVQLELGCRRIVSLYVNSDGSTTRLARGKAGARAARHGETTRSLMIMVYKKAALAQTVQQYDFPDKNFINKVYTHKLNELFAESAPQLIGILGLVMPFAE